MRIVALMVSMTLIFYAAVAMLIPSLPGWLVMGERWIFFLCIFAVFAPTCWYLLSGKPAWLRWLTILANAAVGLFLWWPVASTTFFAGSEISFATLSAATGLLLPFAFNLIALVNNASYQNQ